ncbi:MAG: hypothetical protein KGL43_21970 [Burkholderiales bacterium]|nr:hypothetical protein [Burkholderiales bacterium]MDE2393875.1 hypothetical protein [Burkholderiales bacterium]MDE2456264.1 hypothetical protein [Burkholderiales bacterium]
MTPATESLAPRTGDSDSAPLDATAAPLPARAPPPLASDLMRRAAQGAHEGIDRMAASAAPQLEQLDATVASANQAVQVKVDQMRRARDEWADDLRCTVRRNPLTALLAAVAFGTLIARLMR